jgi:hypothetical protein
MKQEILKRRQSLIDGSLLSAPSIKFNSTSSFDSNVLIIRTTSFDPTPSMLTSFKKVGPFENVTKCEMWVVQSKSMASMAFVPLPPLMFEMPSK